MIKKFWAMLLSVAMVLTILPTIVFAAGPTPLNTATYSLWVGDRQVTSENANDVLGDGTVSYDAESNTLALNGAKITQSHTAGVYTSGIYSEGDINITFTGENSINISGGMIAAGIHANGVIELSGSGSLNLTVSGGSSETRAISTGYTDMEAGVVINSGTVTINADGVRGIYAVYVDSSYGTQLPERYLRINGGMVEMDAESTSLYSCYATNIQPDLSGYEDYSATAILNSWEELQAYNENSWSYYRYIKIQPLVYDENGISEDKEHFQPAALAEDGYYEIKNAGNLFWFAEKLAESDDNDTLNARLISDITMPEGMNWVAMQVGTYGRPYNGTFDGAGYTISNLSAASDNMANVYNNEGLFKTIGENGTVKNLGLINPSVKPSSGCAGAICGTNHGLIENCYNLGGEISANYTWAGGIAGENDGIIKQCYNTGTVTSTTGSSIGGIAGYSHGGGEISDCYNTGNITGQWYVGGICGQLNGGTVKNCYGTGTATAAYPGYSSTANPIVGVRLGSYTVENTYYINSSENNGGGKTSAQFASGEVAYLLNANRSDNVWGQTISTEDAPVLDGTPVYAGYEYCYSDSITYSNDSGKVHDPKPAHNFGKLEYDENYHWYSCTNDGCTEIDGKEAHNGGEATYFKKAVCTVCGQEYGSLPVDDTPPTGKISVGTYEWTTFLDDVEFDLFFKEAQTVEISGYDDSYDADGYTEDKAVTIEYYLYGGETALTKDDLADMEFTPYTGPFEISPDNHFVVYVKITDYAGNVTYINSSGIVLDQIAPDITGIDSGSTYFTTQSLTVTDANLDSITVNNKPVEGTTFTLNGNVDTVYTIVATDKAGNETTFTVTMKPISDLAEPLSDITAENVTSEDKDILEELLETVNNLAQEDYITTDEKNSLQDIKEDLESLLDQLENAAQGGNTENITKVEDITSDNVTMEDKDDLIDAKEDLENALENFGGNYTEEEKTALEEKLEQINQALESIEKTENAEGSISRLPDTVEPDDTETEALIKDAKEQYDALTDHERSLISEELKNKLDNLLEELTDYQIIKGNGSKWTVGDSDPITMTANGAYSKFTGIQVDGKDIDPSNYTAESGSTVITLKPEYLKTLDIGEHTLTVLYTDGQASGEFEVLKKTETNKPGTGDGGSAGIWTGLMFAAACGLAVTMACGRKKRFSK